MAQFKEINAVDAGASARLVDAEMGHFGPTLSGGAINRFHGVEISSLGTAQIGRFRLVGGDFLCRAVQFPIESRP